jgi:hypothetical protein
MTGALSFSTLPIFCTAGNKVQPDSTTLTIGWQPQQQPPCEFFNFMSFAETTNLSTLASGINNVIAELDLIVTSGGGSANSGLTNQVMAGLNTLFLTGSNKNSFFGSNWPSALNAGLGANWGTALNNNYKGNASSSASSYTIPSNYSYFLFLGACATTQNVYLPAISSVPVGAEVKVIQGVSSLNVITQGADVIGEYAGTVFTLEYINDYVCFVTDGNRWFVIGTNGPSYAAIQNAPYTTAIAGAWTNAGNSIGLTISVPPGVYDIDAALTAFILVNGSYPTNEISASLSVNTVNVGNGAYIRSGTNPTSGSGNMYLPCTLKAANVVIGAATLVSINVFCGSTNSYANTGITYSTSPLCAGQLVCKRIG